MSLEINSFYEESVLFTFESVKEFARLSGDLNPIHVDPDFARETVFKRCIVHGVFAGSIFSKILATSFPGPGTVYLDQSFEFKKPVFPDEPYKARLTVCEHKVTSSGKNIYKMNTQIFDEESNILLNGIATVLF